ncbi:nuclear transport factor 2 family protein [Streptomyces sp. NPDC049577]|uniref:nuclear transport factor 2 family protein n=1 Tax=Streptomyces sp. NPDC049577 TaxID=3155153 RepID=UPI003435DF92
MTPEDVYRRSLDLILDKDIDGWLALCDEHVVIEFPYAPEGFPARLEGRAAVADYLRGYPEFIDLRAVPSLRIHRTADDGTIVAEWRGTGRMVATGAPYDMSYVAVVTVRDGRFVHYRDYWNPSAIPGSPDEAKFFSTAGSAR